MDYKSIEELIKAVSDSNVMCFEIETEDISIKMEKNKQQAVVENISLNAASVELDNQKLLNEKNVVTNEAYVEKLRNNIARTIDNKEKIIPQEDLFIVKSPIFGTMYSAPGSDAKNFVKVGSKVEKGDTLCILEAMKLMNEIESEVDGEIVEVLVSNEDMVEYGQPLFKIVKN